MDDLSHDEVVFLLGLVPNQFNAAHSESTEAIRTKLQVMVNRDITPKEMAKKVCYGLSIAQMAQLRHMIIHDRDVLLMEIRRVQDSVEDEK